MEVNCEGCAGCCLDWRPIGPGAGDHERRGPYDPLDDVYNLVPLTREDVRGFLEAGLADAMTPRLWGDEDGVDLGGHRVAAIDGKPVFFLGLRKLEKPVGPFGTDPNWLPTCVFLDPTTLRCRIHGSELYPAECADYPGHNLDLGAETECERVEDAFGGDRLLDDDPPEETPGMRLGPGAVGWKVFVHPDPHRLDGVADRIAAGDPTAEDRAEFVAAAAAGAPGTTEINRDVFEDARERALEAESWVGGAAREWEILTGEAAPEPDLAERVEDERGAPPTDAW